MAEKSWEFMCKLVNLLDHALSSVAPLKSLYFHWTAICSSSIVFTPRSLFLLFVLLFSGLIVEDLTTAATSPHALTSRSGMKAHSSEFEACDNFPSFP